MSEILTVYSIPRPQTEFKAGEEIRRAGYAFDLPTETIERRTAGRKPVTREVPLMRGYMPATGKPRDAKYIGRAIGPVERVEIIRLQTNADRMQRRPAPIVNPYTIGQSVLIGEVPGVIATTNGDECVVAVILLGKQHLRPLHYSRLRPG